MIIETAAVLAALFVPAGHVRLPAQSPVAAKPIQWEGAQTFASSAYRTGAPYSAAAYEPSAAPVYYVRGEKTELFNHSAGKMVLTALCLYRDRKDLQQAYVR